MKFIILSIWCLFTCALMAMPPAEVQKVSDGAKIFSKQDNQLITNKINEIERLFAINLQIVVEPTINGLKIEDLAKKIVTDSLGGNGVVFLIAMYERKIRIQVGKKIIAKIPEKFCEKIIEEDIVPEFKAKNYTTGILMAINHLQSNLQNPPINSEIKAIIVIGIILIIALIIYVLWKRNLKKIRNNCYRSELRSSNSTYNSFSHGSNYSSGNSGGISSGCGGGATGSW